MRRLALVMVAAFAGSTFEPAVAAQCTFPNAEAAGCVCTLAVDLSATGPVAQLTEIIGDVAVTSQISSPMVEPVPVYVGNGIVVPSDGQATLIVGPDCRTVLPADTSLVIRQEGGCVCAGTFGAGTFGAGNNGAGGGGAAAVAGVVVVGGAAAAALLASGGDDNDENPVSP